MKGLCLFIGFCVGAAAMASQDEPAAAQTTCPAETTISHSAILDFANGERYVLNRRQVGLADSATVQVLTDTNAPVCQSLYSFAQSRAEGSAGDLTGFVLVFYRVGARYIAVFSRVPKTITPHEGYVHIRTGMVPIYVFDSNLRLIGTYGL